MDLVVGRIVKAHGIAGELVVDVRTDEPELRFAPGSRLRIRMPKRRSVREDVRGTGPKAVAERDRREPAEYRWVTVRSVRAHGQRLLVRLTDIGDRAAADEVRGGFFLVDAADLPPSSTPDEFYDHELEGLTAQLTDGTSLGTVHEVLHTAAGELLSIRLAQDSREVLVPFVRQFVPSISLTEGVLLIDPPDGLLDPS